MAVCKCPIFDVQALKNISKSMFDGAQILGTNKRRKSPSTSEINQTYFSHIAFSNRKSQSYCTAELHKEMGLDN